MRIPLFKCLRRTKRTAPLAWCGILLFTAGLLPAMFGCTSISSIYGGKTASLESQNRMLLEQNKAQLAELENLKHHGRRLEDKLIEAEQQLATLDQQLLRQRQQLAASRHGPANLADQPTSRFPSGDSRARGFNGRVVK